MYPLRFTNEEARTIAIALDEVHWLGKSSSWTSSRCG